MTNFLNLGSEVRGHSVLMGALSLIFSLIFFSRRHQPAQVEQQKLTCVQSAGKCKRVSPDSVQMGSLWRVHAACDAPLSSFCLFFIFLWLFYMHLNGNPVDTGCHNIWWRIVLTVCVVPVLRADTGKGVELCFHLWTCSSVTVRLEGLCGFIRVSACWPGSRLTFKLGLLGFKRLSDHSCFSCLSTQCSSQRSPLTANTDFWFTCAGTGFGGQTPDFNLSDIVSASTCSRRTISESQGQGPPWLDLDTFHLNHFELCWGFGARCEARAEHWVISWC